jgi:hypothetical protein
MGCWNKTCSLTNLPIYSGEEVYVFVLEKKNMYDSCHATGHYAPVLIPFESEYNDYGGGENSSGVGLLYVLAAVKENLVEREAGENTSHDLAVTRSSFGEEQFFKSILKQRLTISTSGPESYVDFAMMRKDCVDAILNTWQIEDCKYNHESNEVNYFKYGYDDLVKEATDYILAIKDLVEKNDATAFLFMNNMEEYPVCSKLARTLDFDDYQPSRMLRGQRIVRELVEAGKIEQAEEFIKEYLKGAMLNIFLESTRKQWMPGGHEGSQGQELEPYELLLQVTQESINKRKAEMEEW